MFDNSTAKNESKPGAICAFLEDTSAEVNLKAFAYCLIAIGSLLGNSLVILVILKNRKMRSPINYLIINMASSDILFTVFVIPRLIVELYSAPHRWFVSGIFGSLLCKLDYFVQDIATAENFQTQSECFEDGCRCCGGVYMLLAACKRFDLPVSIPLGIFSALLPQNIVFLGNLTGLF